MNRRRLLRILSALAGLYLLASLAAGVFLAEITLHLPRRPVRGRAQAEQTVFEQFHIHVQDVSVRSADGTELKGWYVRPREFNGDTVILLHGVTDNRLGVGGYALMFLKHGYAVLLPDARAHGESGGDIATYGIRERTDVTRWTEQIRASTGCTYLFGESMGAAIALQSTAAVPGLCAVAVESPFSQFREIGYDRIARHTNTDTWVARTVFRPAMESALIYARLRYHVDLTEASPENALESSTVPALLIHGTADHNIPIRHSYELMRTCRSHAALWAVQGADHGGAVNVAPEEFERRVIGWFQTHRSQTVSLR